MLSRGHIAGLGAVSSACINFQIWEAISEKLYSIDSGARFDVGQMQFQGNNSLATAGAFGVFLHTLNKPRLMEFALRFTF